MSKISTAKWIRDVAQAVDCLICNYKAPISNPSAVHKMHKETNKKPVRMTKSVTNR
jgi:hypothetical protein